MHGILRVFFLRAVLIYVAHFKESQVGILPVGIVCNAFKTAEEKRGTHDIEV